MSYSVAGIDVHKQILMVAVADVTATDGEFECGRFGSTRSELRRLIAWLAERSVQEVVMESTAQYLATGLAGTGTTFPAAPCSGKIEPGTTRSKV